MEKMVEGTDPQLLPGTEMCEDEEWQDHCRLMTSPGDSHRAASALLGHVGHGDRGQSFSFLIKSLRSRILKSFLHFTC